MQQDIVLVTGASSGIGEAVVRGFVDRGARVVLAARRLDKLEQLVAELGTRTHAVRLDVTVPESVQTMMQALPSEFAEVSVLVNNAGAAFGLDKAQTAKLDDWNQMVDLNIKGLLAVTHAVLPGMVERNRGHILNMGSVAGSWPYPGSHVYGATKAFVEQFSLNLRTDLNGTRIRVTNIEPGMVQTSFSSVRFGGDQAKADAVYAGMEPLTAKDIAETILWASSLPPHVNINRIEIMPVAQALAGFVVDRKT
jgi:3-hydroxy acid dehydrogenase/malonic semialdehyde reductase